MGDEETFTTTATFTCPFCGKRWDAIENSDGVPGAIHEKPTCKEYDEAEDALDFIIACRKKTAKDNPRKPEEFPRLYREAWAVYEAFRKLGFNDDDLSTLIADSVQAGPNTLHIVLKAQDKEFVYFVNPLDLPVEKANEVWKVLIASIASGAISDKDLQRMWEESIMGSSQFHFAMLATKLKEKGFILPALAN